MILPLLLHSSTKIYYYFNNYSFFGEIRVCELLKLVRLVVVEVVVVVVVVVVVAVVMGCGGSKYEDDQQQQVLLKLCRERKQLLKSAAEHRFALAAAHAAYFGELTVVGEKLWRFVEEELVLLSSSSSSSISSLSSPVITIPSDDFKSEKVSMKNQKVEFDNLDQKKNKKKKMKNNLGKNGGNLEDDEDNSHNSHLHWSSSGENEEDDDDEHEHVHDHRKNHRGKAAKAAEQKSRGGESPKPGISYIPDHDLRPPYYSFDPSNSYGGYPNYPTQSPYYSNDYVDSGFNSYSNYPEYSSNYYNGSNNININSNSNEIGSSYGFGSNTTYTGYYMKKSNTKIPTVIYEEPKYVNNPIYAFSDSQGYSSNYQNVVNHRQEEEQEQKKVLPPTPPSPKVSAWDYFNPFESFEGGGVGGVGVGGGLYGGVQPPGMGMYGYGNGSESNSSSPDSREVREREGIPDLEEETETEVSFPMSNTKKVAPQKGGKSVKFQDHVHEIPASNKGKKINNVRYTGSSSGSSSATNFDEGSSRRTPFVEQEPELEVVDEEREVEDSSSLSPETEASIVTLSSSGEEHGHDHDHEHDHNHDHDHQNVYVKKKGVSFEVEEGGGSSHGMQSSMPSSLTTLSADGTRDLREVVREIKEEFEAATDYGKEVSTLLEVGRAPYRSRSTLLKVILAKMCSTSLPLSDSPSGLSTGYPEGDLDSRSLASTLDKLYVWEKKLYKEIKGIVLI
ncbi:hypothetical protein RND81_09G192800 [Saponaria officinalis]|uniref:Uncharacterized protein n=1 Tax=Saponaria officinalis TaxID=3572 RepID=A0AAW1IQD5_SAPOF